MELTLQTVGKDSHDLILQAIFSWLVLYYRAYLQTENWSSGLY